MGNEWYFGKIDWISDYYNFGEVIDRVNGNSYFYHIRQNSLAYIVKGTLCVFQVASVEVKGKGKEKQAVNMKALFKINDLDFVKELLLSIDDSLGDRPTEENLSNKMVPNARNVPVVSDLKTLINRIEATSDSNLESLLKRNDSSEIDTFFSEEKFSVMETTDFVKKFHDYLQEHIRVFLSKNYIEKILRQFNDENGINLLDKAVFEIEEIQDESSYKTSLELINLSGNIGNKTRDKVIKRFGEIASPPFIIAYWIDGYSKEDVPYEIIAECYLSLPSFIKKKLDRLIGIKGVVRVFELVLSEADMFESVKEASVLNTILAVIDNWDESDRKMVVGAIAEKSSGSVLLDLWLLGYNVVQFDSVNGLKLLEKAAYETEEIQDESAYEKSLELIKLGEELGSEAQSKIIRRFVEIASPYYAVLYWSEDYTTENVSYEIIAECYLSLPSSIKKKLDRLIGIEGVARVFELVLSEADTFESVKEASVLNTILAVIDNWDESDRKMVVGAIAEKSSDSVLLDLWLLGYNVVQFDSVNGLKLLEKAAYETEEIQDESAYEKSLELIKLGEELGSEAQSKIISRFVEIASPYYAVLYWSEEYTKENVSHEIIAKCYFDLPNFLKENLDESIGLHGLANVFKLIVSDLERFNSIDDDSVLKAIMEIIDNWSIEERKEVVEAITEKSSDSLLLDLWLLDYSDFFDFHIFKNLCFTLSSDKQVEFLKKLFYQHKLGLFELNIELLSELVVFDRNTFDDAQVDYSVDIVLNTIFDIAKGNKIEEKNITNLLIEHCDRDAFTVFKISGFFENCDGRGRITIDEENQDNDEIEEDKKELKYKKKRTKVPNGIQYCEGRKADELDNIYGQEFWWCRNAPCFLPCQTSVEHKNWKNFTLSDFLDLLGLKFDKDQYYTFIGWINRLNILLEHLNCRDCGKVMKPAGQSDYSFYRVNKFHCDNDNCAFTDKVYLNHCLTKKCSHIIDSRDSVKCPNGLYVCPGCSGCCSTKMYSNQIENRRYLGKPIPASLENKVKNNMGHQERNMSFCYKCGHELTGGWQEFDKALKWLNANKGRDQRIIKSGVRKQDGKSWFILNFGTEKIENLSKLGFLVSDTKQGDNIFVSEPFDNNNEEPKYCTNSQCSLNSKNESN